MKRWTHPQILDLPTPKTKRFVSLGDGLYLVLYPSGGRSFATIAKNAKGHPQPKAFARVKLPGVEGADLFTLEQARLYVLEHAVARATARKDDLERQVHERRSLTFQDLTTDFVREKITPRNIDASRKRRYEHTLTAHFCNRPIPRGSGTWGDLRLADFGGGDWADRYENTLLSVQQRAALGGDRRGPCTLAHQTDQFAQQLFAYGVKRGLIRPEHVPQRLEHVNRPRNVTRTLSVPEIEHLLNVTTKEAVYGNDAINEFDACFLRLLLITGIRLNSIRLARRSQHNRQVRGFWTFPAEDLKETSAQREEPTDHHIPVSALMLREIERLNAVSGEFDFLFPERYASAENAQSVRPRDESWAKHLLSEHESLLKNKGAHKYTAHAFRRTMANIMEELGISPAVIDKAQARIPRGTAKTYLTAEVRDQIENAFEQWHDFLHACMLGKGEDYLEDVRRARTADMRKENAARRKRLGLKPLVAA